MENTFILKGYRKTVLVLEPDKSGGFLASFPGEATAIKGVLYLFTDEENFLRLSPQERGKGDPGKIVAAALEEDGTLTLTASHAKNFSWSRAKAHLRLMQPAPKKVGKAQEAESPVSPEEEEPPFPCSAPQLEEKQPEAPAFDPTSLVQEEPSSLESAADAYVRFITQDMPLADSIQANHPLSPILTSAEPTFQPPYDFLSQASPLTGSFFQPQEFTSPPQASSPEPIALWSDTLSSSQEEHVVTEPSIDQSTPLFPLEEISEEESVFCLDESNAPLPDVPLDAQVPPSFGQDACPLSPDVSLLCPFPQTFPESQWRKVHFPHSSDGNHYLVGEIYHQGQLAAKAVAMPGHYAPSPPPWLKGFDLYLKARSGAEGYWLSIREV